MALLVPSAFAAVLAGFALVRFRGDHLLVRACLGAAGAALVWALVLGVQAKRTGRRFALQVGIFRHHWVQALAQATVFFWWGRYVPLVYAFLPLVLVQLLFAYAVEALLTWSRRDRYSLGFGPFPVVGSINLFLWFRPEWFAFQFALIALGYLGKDLIRWQRDGRSAHIFNPSSFPLAISSAVLMLFGASDITFGNFIANSQHDPPHIYLVIFLAALPGQLLFGVARMTLAAVVTMYLFGVVYLQVTGTYFFYDSFIPVPVFLGMHLLFTDPSTSPRSEAGRILYGVLYAFGTLAFYVLLTRGGIPTFYDKLLPVPLMNLTVRLIDGWVSPLGQSGRRRARDDEPDRRAASARRGHVAWALAWSAIFVLLSATRGVGDRHPGQYLPFWVERCGEGNLRACDYASFLTLTYCNNGSGWACNEVGVEASERGRSPVRAFERGCSLGFQPACENAAADSAPRVGWAHGPPALGDLPIVLRGTKPALAERDAERLRELACAQGWEEVCAG